LRIEVRLRLEHGGFCRFTLLPQRGATLPDVLTVADRDTSVSLTALQDEWYQDVERKDLGALLQHGIEWEWHDRDGEVIRWSLSGREVFVLGQHDELSGFVTTPRLVLGERHTVLCVHDRADEVRVRLQATGSAAPTYFDETLGAPSGWVGFRDVVPTVPLNPSGEGDILDALCPQPNFEIVLNGGIPLHRSVWLAGFPPRIRLRGDAAAAGQVLVDGRLATVDPEDGAFVVDGWDRLGDHQVWSGGKSASYSVAFGDEQWEPWDAYRWSFGEVVPTSIPKRPAVCGALTLPPLSSEAEGSELNRRGLVIAASNPVLLGASPGQVYVAALRGDLRSRSCTVFPPFEPVWALPSDPLHCEKSRTRVLLVGPLREPDVLIPSPNTPAWCSAILAASRKGLFTQPDTGAVVAVWSRYKQLARALRKRFR
jgi:hypothetical protein